MALALSTRMAAMFKAARVAKGLTQQEAGRALGIHSVSRWADIEQSHRMPTATEARRFALVFRVDMPHVVQSWFNDWFDLEAARPPRSDRR